MEETKETLQQKPSGTIVCVKTNSPRVIYQWSRLVLNGNFCSRITLRVWQCTLH